MVHHKRLFYIIPLIVLLFVNSGWDDSQNEKYNEGLLGLCKHAQEHEFMCEKLRVAQPVLNLVESTEKLCEQSGLDETCVEIRKLIEEIEPGSDYIDSIIQVKTKKSAHITNIIRLLFNIESYLSAEKVTFICLDNPSEEYSKWACQLTVVSRHLLGSLKYDENLLREFYGSIKLKREGCSVEDAISIASDYSFDSESTESKYQENLRLMKILHRLLAKEEVDMLLSRLITKNKELTHLLDRHSQFELNHSIFPALHLMFQVFNDHSEGFQVDTINSISIDIRKSTPMICLANHLDSPVVRENILNLINESPGFTALEEDERMEPGAKNRCAQDINIRLDLDTIKKASEGKRKRFTESGLMDINDYSVIWKGLSSQPKINKK